MRIEIRSSAMALSLTCAPLALFCAASAEEPTARITIIVDGEETTVVVQESAGAAGGAHQYTGQLETHVGSTVGWDLAAQLDPSEQTLITGTVALDNPTDSEVDYVFRVELPLCPEIADHSVLGAYAQFTLVTDSAGGAIDLASEGASAWSIVCDGEPAAGIFLAPFTLGASGAGVASTSATLGEPFPSLPGPGVRRDAGLMLQFSLTPGEVATVNNMVIIGADPQDLAPCNEGDVNGDGATDILDMLELLSQWGTCPGCSGDLDGNGLVDVTDMLVLIAHWE